MYDENVYREELESLTNKVFMGDFTPLVFDLLKDSLHLDALLQYLGGEEISNVPINESDKSLRQESYNRPCFEEWFSHAERL